MRIVPDRTDCITDRVVAIGFDMGQLLVPVVLAFVHHHRWRLSHAAHGIRATPNPSVIDAYRQLPDPHQFTLKTMPNEIKNNQS